MPGCFVPIPVPAAVGPTFFLQVSQCHCRGGEKGTFPPAKAAVPVERLSLVTGQGERGCTVVTESRDGVSLTPTL